MKLLSSYGSRRLGEKWSAEGAGEHFAPNSVPHKQMLEWLVASRSWNTPLHHLEIIDVKRARELLRDGDGILARVRAVPPETPSNLPRETFPWGPTPLSLANIASMIGCRVVVREIAARPELNGQAGVAESYSDASGRFKVKLDGGFAGALRPANLHLARELEPAPGGSVPQLIIQASKPWSPQTHDLFPAGARAQAVMLLRNGYLLFMKESRFGATGRSLYDCWVAHVIPHAILREDWDRLVIGSWVRIHSLRGNPANNGKMGQILAFDKEKQRYTVHTYMYSVESPAAGTRDLLVKRSNLVRDTASPIRLTE